ncbi:hypothetical protein COCOBI_09-5720 [Coccomyxa sp. Obi]|nr:hypothetical protein COCOBI_09-5720 [Coccomyxa sp. Obi]
MQLELCQSNLNVALSDNDDEGIKNAQLMTELKLNRQRGLEEEFATLQRKAFQVGAIYVAEPSVDVHSANSESGAQAAEGGIPWDAATSAGLPEAMEFLALVREDGPSKAAVDAALSHIPVEQCGWLPELVYLNGSGLFSINSGEQDHDVGAEEEPLDTLQTSTPSPTGSDETALALFSSKQGMAGKALDIVPRYAPEDPGLQLVHYQVAQLEHDVSELRTRMQKYEEREEMLQREVQMLQRRDRKLWAAVGAAFRAMGNTSLDDLLAEHFGPDSHADAGDGGVAMARPGNSECP